MRERILLTLLLLLLSTSSWAENNKIHRAGPDKIKDEYIVVLEDDVLPDQVPDVARQLAAQHGGEVKKTWSSALKGFFVTMPEARAEALSRNPKVKYVEENAPMYLSPTTQTNVNPITCDPTSGACATVTDNRLWHLDRADQTLAAPNDSYSYCTTGSGVTIYVVDTGVVGAHAEFGGRVQPGYNSSGDFMPANDPCLGFALPPTGFYENLERERYDDEVLGAGHGTAVASALGGRRVGIAKGVTIVPIKVGRCDWSSARDRIPAHLYQMNETVFIVDRNGVVRAHYRALNAGFSSGSTTNPDEWPTLDNANFVDGQVTWRVIPRSELYQIMTLQMTIDGLNWILSSQNPGPKSNAVVTLSTYRLRTDSLVTSLEDAIRNLLNNNMTVIASANNQNGNACDTSPGRLSRGNPDPSLRNKVITAGGSMIINRPWDINLAEPPISDDAVPADGANKLGVGSKGPEPAYDPLQGVRDGRWICGPGDSDGCSNATPRQTSSITFPNAYVAFTGGSNAGPCVTLFAPAKNLFLASNAGANSYRDARVRAAWTSGTSWSAPIVAGFAARILQTNPTYTPDQVYNVMMANVSEGVLDADTLNTYDIDGNEITGTPNKLLRLADVTITSSPQSTPIAITGSTTFTVGAGGTTTLQYQWYQVNAGFDYTTYRRGAYSSTPIAGATSSTLQVTPTAQTAYWVRVTNSCGSADSDIVVAVPRPAAPANVVATANGTTTVTVTWTAASGANNYEVQRKIVGADWTPAGTVHSGSLSFTDTPPVTAGGMVIYRVLSTAGSAYLPPGNPAYSAPSNMDFANLKPYTNDPLAGPPNRTAIQAQHIVELRQAVNALCDAAGSARLFTDAEVQLSALQNQPADDAHYTVLMVRINNIRGTLGIAPASFRTAPAAGLLITVADLDDLRNALR